MMKNYTWMVPFLCGIISLLSVLTPVASLYSSFSIWMWGLTLSRFPDISIGFIEEPIILITGISASALIVLVSVILITTGYGYKLGYFNNRKIARLWITAGILALTATIMAIIALDFHAHDEDYPIGIWSFFSPGFAVIAPILGAILTIGTGILLPYAKPRRNRQSMPIATMAPKKACPTCNKTISFNASFCSKCGNIIEKNIQ